MTTADLLAAAAKLLYGEHWVTGLAVDLNLDPRTIKAWMSGRRELKADNDVLQRVMIAVGRRQRELAKVETELSRVVVTRTLATSAAAAPRPSRPAARR